VPARKRYLLLFHLIVIALAIVGFAYTSWTDQLFVECAGNTAELNLTFSFVSEPTEYDPLNAATVNVNPKGYLVGDVDVITLTVNNAYPTYAVTIFFRVTNIGALPAKFKGFTLNSQPASYLQGRWSASLPNGEIEVEGYNGEGEIIGVSETRTYSVTVKVTNNAQPETTYTFTIGLLFEQAI